MKYRWSKYKLLCHQSRLKSMLKENLSIDTLKEIKFEIKHLSLLLKGIGYDYVFEIVKKSELASPESISLYKKLSPELQEIILSSATALKNLYAPEIDIVDENSKHTIEEVISLSRGFYKTLPNKTLINDFDYFTNPKNHLLRYNKKIITSGLTSYFLYPSPVSYLSICPDTMLKESVSLNHEVAHGIYLRSDTLESTTNNHKYLIELEGAFFNFLSFDYLKSIYDESQVKIVYYEYMCAVYDALIALFINKITIEEQEKNSSITLKELGNIISSYGLPISQSERNIRMCLDENFEKNYQLFFSFLVALDLKELYDKDPEKAFYNFESIRNNKTDDILTNLRSNGITFMDDGYKSLKREMKKFCELDK